MAPSSPRSHPLPETRHGSQRDALHVLPTLTHEHHGCPTAHCRDEGIVRRQSATFRCCWSCPGWPAPHRSASRQKTLNSAKITACAYLTEITTKNRVVVRRTITTPKPTGPWRRRDGWALATAMLSLAMTSYFLAYQPVLIEHRKATGVPKLECALARQAIPRCLETPPAAFPIPASQSPLMPTGNQRS